MNSCSLSIDDSIKLRRNCEKTCPFIESPISICEFERDFLLPNRPCVLGEWSTRDWPARLLWTQNGVVDHDYLRENYGSAICPVADCANASYDNPAKSDSSLSHFLDYADHCSITAENSYNIAVDATDGLHRGGDESSTRSLVARSSTHGTSVDQSNSSTVDVGRCGGGGGGDESLNPIRYLKDWHFVKQFPEKSVYTVHQYFSSDWLNEYYDDMASKSQGVYPQGIEAVVDDYRFVYLGVAGSHTPFHCDVLRSHSWSANVAGVKRWTMYPPVEDEHHDFDDRLKRLQAGEQLRGRLTFQQLAGQTVFVPSGWCHRVDNVTEALSINHNWFNAASVDLTLSHLLVTLDKVEREIIDCKQSLGDQWDDHCQLFLKSLCGMNFKSFFDLLHTIFKNITQEKHKRRSYTFDLLRIEEVLGILKKFQSVENLCIDLISDIQQYNSNN